MSCISALTECRNIVERIALQKSIDLDGVAIDDLTSKIMNIVISTGGTVKNDIFERYAESFIESTYIEPLHFERCREIVMSEMMNVDVSRPDIESITHRVMKLTYMSTGGYNDSDIRASVARLISVDESR